MKTEKSNQIKKFSPRTTILGAKGYRKNGEGMNVYKVSENGKVCTIWEPVGGGAA